MGGQVGMLVRQGRWLTARPGADIGCMRTFLGEKENEDLEKETARHGGLQ